jgi:hypothetical protein
MYMKILKPGATTPPTMTFRAVKPKGTSKIMLQDVVFKGGGEACFTGIAPDGAIHVVDPK